MFTVKTNISQFDTFEQFAKNYNLGAKDLVITQSFIYEPFIKALNLPCIFIMQDKYGAGEPSDEMINQVLAEVGEREFDRVIGIGGGTVIDISKIFVLGVKENISDAFERKVPIVKRKQLVIVPTTCGTGSEVTNISIAEIKAKHTKMGLADNAILADDAVLIPELLKSLPFKPYAFSAIDALIHATESYLSPKATPYSRMFSVEAIKIIIDIFKGIAKEGPEYRLGRLEEMLRASNYAGIAFGNAGCGAVHALSYPLGGNYHVPHGEANYQFYTHIFKIYTQKDPNGAIKDLNNLLAELLGAKVEVVYEELDNLLGNLTAKRPLHEYGMKEEETELFADSVVATQQRLLGNNYAFLTRDEIAQVYKDLF